MNLTKNQSANPLANQSAFSIWTTIGLKLLSFAAISLGSLVIQALETSAAAQAIWYNCLTREVFTPEKQAWCDRWQTLQNADYIVPTSHTENSEYTTVILENGHYEQPDRGILVSLANERGWMTFGDINNDGKEDAAVIFGVVPGGTALATYLTVVLDVDGSAQALTPTVLGQRIALNGPITIDNARVTVPLLTSTAANNHSFFVDGSHVLELTQLPSSEETIVLCEGDRRNTTRVYLSNGQMKMRVYDRQDGVVWLNTDAMSETNPEVTTYSNQFGEVTVRVAVNRNSRSDCSIQVGDQTLELGTVLAGGNSTGTPEDGHSASEPFLSDVPSPAGGTVKQVTLPGPETSVLVVCDRNGFEPFFFTDQGNWVGCQTSAGTEPGTPSQLMEPVLSDVPSPVGGTVKQVTLPGPETSVLVICDRNGFEPFFFTDQGNWVGCQMSD
jgi:hypothetical protein